MRFQLPRALIVELASEQQRLHHYLWHRIRTAWEAMPASEQQAVIDIDPGWKPPRPAADASRTPYRDNYSGEDFLYMHRMMLAHVNQRLRELGELPVTGWNSVPRPEDADYPVPPYPTPVWEKTAEFWEAILRWEARYTDPERLRNLTLGQLGSDIEVTIHNSMHRRWMEMPALGRRPENTSAAAAIDPVWNAPEYDHLEDQYASHVNPVFWKLHGWIDDRIDQWAAANDMSKIEWQGTWVGPPHHVHASHDADASNDVHAPPTQPLQSMWLISQILDKVGASGYVSEITPEILRRFDIATPAARP